MTDSATPGAWISEYDYPNRRVTLTLADSEAVGHHWTGIRKDQSFSDPGGDFDVYVSHRPERDADLLESHAIVKIVATLSEDGDIKNLTLTSTPTRLAHRRSGRTRSRANALVWLIGSGG